MGKCGEVGGYRPCVNNIKDFIFITGSHLGDNLEVPQFVFDNRISFSSSIVQIWKVRI